MFVSLLQHALCSLAGTRFATPHAQKFGSVFEGPGRRIKRFHTSLFKPGGPQRENACGRLILGIRLRSCNVKNGAVTCTHLRYDQTACGGWVGYVAIDDVDATAAQIGRLGGASFVPPTDSNIGRISVVADPQKAAFALVKEPAYGQRKPGRLDEQGRAD